jgi:hypothetical protein
VQVVHEHILSGGITTAAFFRNYHRGVLSAWNYLQPRS